MKSGIRLTTLLLLFLCTLGLASGVTANGQTAAAANYGTFTVGGSSTSYYAVQFVNNITSYGGMTGANTSDLVVYRDDVHENGSWFGSFNLVVSFHPQDYGEFPNPLEKLIYQTGIGSPYGDPVGDIEDGSFESAGNDIIIWLKGGGTYHWRNKETTAGWTLGNGNAAGGSIVDSSGITHDPITAQSTLILNAKNNLYVNALGIGTPNSLYVGGNVGIGTTTPAAVLEVNGSTQLDGGLTFSSASPGITFANGSSLVSAPATGTGITTVGNITSGTWQGSPIASSYLPSDIDYTDTPQTISGQKIFSSDVGIGTTAPSQLLQVGSTYSQNPSVMIGGHDSNNSDTGYYSLLFGAFRDVEPNVVSGIVATPTWTCCGGYPTSGYGGVRVNTLGFYTLYDPTNPSNYSPNMLIDAHGNVGIGTPTPNALLEVNGGTQLDGNLTFSSTVYGIKFANGSSLTSAPATGTDITTVGNITSGTWQGSPIASSFLPSDIVYTDTPQTISGQKMFTSNVEIGTASPQTSLQIGTFGPYLFPGGGGLTTDDASSAIGFNLYRGADNNWHTTTDGANGGGYAFVGNTAGELFLLQVPSVGNVSQSLVDSTVWPSKIAFSVVNGNVGIGTATPGQNLQELNSSNALVPYSGTGPVLEIKGTVAISQGSQGGGGSMIFPDGTVQSTAWNGTTLGGDYAESVDVLGNRKSYEPGDIIVIDPSSPGNFTKSQQPYSKLVAGVFSTKPGLVGRRTTAARPDKKDEVPMAMMGIVPTKVSTENGPIEPGDLLVSASTPGYAMKGTDHDRLQGAVIGKALAPLKSGFGVIEVLIALQ